MKKLKIKTKHITFKKDEVLERVKAERGQNAKAIGVGPIILSVVLPVHSVKGTLKFPGDIQGRKDRADLILAGCTGNSYVSITTAVITAAQATIDNYDGATPANRPGLYKTMKDYFQNNLLAPFQAKADSDPVNSVAILNSGNFHVKGQYIPQVHQFTVEKGTESGSVMLTAPGGPTERHLHDWMYSADGNVWTRLLATCNAYKLVSNLALGKYAYFTHELVVKDVPQGISQIIRIMVS